VVWQGSPGSSRQLVPAATWPGGHWQLPSAEQTLPSAAQFLTQQRACPAVSCWHTAVPAHCCPGQAKPTGGSELQPLPGVQPFAQGVLATVPALQVRWLLPSHSIRLPSHCTQPLPVLLQNEPAPQAAEQQIWLPWAVATHAPEAQSLPCAQEVPAPSAQSPEAGSQTHWMSGRRLVK
jgi:hypothetical protein